MRRSLFPFLLLLALLCLSVGNVMAENTRAVFRFPLDAVDPSPSANPRGATSPGFRGENQMVIYTPAFGASTQTNTAGAEAVVEQGKILDVNGGDSEIPQDGFIISGHGSAAQWMGRFAKPGALASIDEDSRQLVIRMTPQVYLYEIDQALARAKARTPVNAEAYQQHLAEAERCRAELSGMADGEINSEMARLSDHCEQEADRAYYQTIASVDDEFRGAWIRPDSLDPAQIEKTVARLKENHIREIFLETYYQGKTIYPSDVMAAYGLPVQHSQFKGGDPLKLWIAAAHAQGLKVHLWSQVFFAGNERESLEQYGPILNKYPQWRNIERPSIGAGIPVKSDVEPGHYFLDPANPEVRIFLQKLLMELVSNYDADGLNLDYIRYPASAHPGKSNYLNTSWGYTESARQQFKSLIDAERKAAETARLDAMKKAGQPVPKNYVVPKYPSADPKDFTLNDPLWPRWVAWRKEQVSSFVKEISEKTHAVKPGMLISAVVFPSSDPLYAVKLQDYPRWAKEGWVQALTPIGLSTRLDLMARQCQQLKDQVENKIPVYVGIFGMYNRATPVDLLGQIDTVHQSGMPGVVLFDFVSRLTPEYQQALTEGPFRE